MRSRLLMTTDTVGGVWTYTLELAGALAPLGFETVLAVLGPPADDRQRASAERINGLRLVETGLPLDWLAADETAVRSASTVIATLARREAVDLVQLNQPALAVAPMPAPAIVAIHSCVATWWAVAGDGPLPVDFAWQTALVAEGLARANAVVCPTYAFAEQVGAVYALVATPRVVHNGRSPSPSIGSRLADEAFTAGRLWDRGKNLATLDRAAAMIDVPFEAAGATTGPAGDMIRLDHLRTPGRLDADAMADRLAARPVFASAARYEPFGLAVLEAAQAGCALVLSDIPSFREIWGGVAIFVEPDDAAGFVEAIEALVRDAPRRIAHGDRARERGRRFTPAAMAAGMAELFREASRTRAAA